MKVWPAVPLAEERSRHGDQVPQRPLGALQRERAVIAGCIRAETDVSWLRRLEMSA